MSALRLFAGGVTWASPALSWRLFGFGKTTPDAATGLLGRLFGVRDAVLAAGLHHRNPAVKKAVLQAGLICDSADVVASLIALRKGAPKFTMLSVTAGAGLFVAIGAAALNNSR
jgi:hypothetical protein